MASPIAREIFNSDKNFQKKSTAPYAFKTLVSVFTTGNFRETGYTENSQTPFYRPPATTTPPAGRKKPGLLVISKICLLDKTIVDTFKTLCYLFQQDVKSIIWPFPIALRYCRENARMMLESKNRYSCNSFLFSGQAHNLAAAKNKTTFSFVFFPGYRGDVRATAQGSVVRSFGSSRCFGPDRKKPVLESC